MHQLLGPLDAEGTVRRLSTVEILSSERVTIAGIFGWSGRGTNDFFEERRNRRIFLLNS